MSSKLADASARQDVVDLKMERVRALVHQIKQVVGLEDSQPPPTGFGTISSSNSPATPSVSKPPGSNPRSWRPSSRNLT